MDIVDTDTAVFIPCVPDGVAVYATRACDGASRDSSYTMPVDHILDKHTPAFDGKGPYFVHVGPEELSTWRQTFARRRDYYGISEKKTWSEWVHCHCRFTVDCTSFRAAAVAYLNYILPLAKDTPLPDGNVSYWVYNLDLDETRKITLHLSTTVFIR